VVLVVVDILTVVVFLLESISFEFSSELLLPSLLGVLFVSRMLEGIGVVSTYPTITETISLSLLLFSLFLESTGSTEVSLIPFPIAASVNLLSLSSLLFSLWLALSMFLGISSVVI